MGSQASARLVTEARERRERVGRAGWEGEYRAADAAGGRMEAGSRVCLFVDLTSESSKASEHD